MSRKKQRNRNSLPASTTVQKIEMPASSASAHEVPVVAVSNSPKWSRWLPYVVEFVLVYVFCTAVYGDVFVRTAEENYVSTDLTTMYFLTSQSWGWIFYAGRWLLLPFLNVWIGAALMALVLTASTAMLDRAFGLPSRLNSLCFFAPALVLGWIIYRGTNIFHRNEPSLIVLVPLALLLLSMVLAVVAWAIRKRNGESVRPTAHRRGWLARMPLGMLSPILLFAALTFCANKYNQNEILTARMQLDFLRGDWDSIIEDAQKAERPTRAVAAYYAIALEQTDQLLDRIYDIPFDYPSPSLDRNSGNEEYSLFEGDCNLCAGLLNPAYRCALDQVVMYGPTAFNFKRLAVAALLNGERQLSEKYLTLIEQMPFQQSFVDRIRPMLSDSALVVQDENFAHILSLYPKESKYEQNYRQPAFLGYNMGLMQGSDATLRTAIAAALYSKAITQCLPHIQILAQKTGGNLPVAVQQALTIMAQNDPQVAAAFPDAVRIYQPMLASFFTQAKTLIDQRNAESAGKDKKQQEEIKIKYNAIMRDELKEEWLGTYFYYYYCENNDPAQTTQPKEKAGVN